MARRQVQPRANPAPNRDPDDSWVDRVADQVQALLSEHGLEMELCVWYDPITGTLDATGFDGSPARYFRGLESERPSEGTPERPIPSEVSSPP